MLIEVDAAKVHLGDAVKFADADAIFIFERLPIVKM